MAAPPIHLFRDTATVERLAGTRVQQGSGFTKQSTVVAAGVRCRLQPSVVSSTADDVEGATLEFNATHAVFFVPTQDVRRDDFLTIRGRRFEVKGVVQDSDAGTVYLKALTIEEQEGA